MKKSLFEYLAFALLFFMPLFASGQMAVINSQKLNSLTVAIAHAEGFGLRRAIPTRYHNPGDLKSRLDLTKLPGQRRLGKGNHVVFANDAAGWAALRDYVSKMVDGRSRRFRPTMTIQQVARMYAGNWRPWVKIVTTELGVPQSTTIAELLFAVDTLPEPPAIRLSSDLNDTFLVMNPVLPTLVQN